MILIFWRCAQDPTLTSNTIQEEGEERQMIKRLLFNNWSKILKASKHWNHVVRSDFWIIVVNFT